jgi:hypothetical protein
MKARLWLYLPMLLLSSAVPVTAAEQVPETWRSLFACPRFLSVNRADGTCWVADSGRSWGVS